VLDLFKPGAFGLRTVGSVIDLRGALDGELFTPDSPGYDAVWRPADVRYAGVRPRLVVRCASAADVARAIGYARAVGLPVVPRGGGHCFAGRSSTDGLLIDLAGLDDVIVAGDGIATIGAGARLAGVYAALHAHRRTVPAGCGATVGIAGLTLGGGIGLLGRAYGLTCDRLIGARVVLADGRVVDCDADHEPDLFWALRGAGGGQFGVVTALRFDTIPEPLTTRFELRWSGSGIARLIEAWQNWAPDAPDDVTATLTVVAEPGTPPHAVMFGAALRESVPTRELLREFTATRGTIRGGLPYTLLKDTFEDSGASERSRSEFFARPLRPETIDRLLAALSDPAAAERRRLTFMAMGGVYNRIAAEATAFAHRDQRFLLEHGAEPSSGWIDRSWEIAHADGSGRVYPNFPDPALDDWASAYHGGNYARLVAVKRAYDPDRLFTFPQSV
jgi:FAD/FMN-containing dehydrogenase